jgi:hypothetical protein
MMLGGTPSNLSHGGRVLSLGGLFPCRNKVATPIAWQAVFKGPSPNAIGGLCMLCGVPTSVLPQTTENVP